ncbi:MAG: geranylgeranyl reductase family protein [Chitinivibrionales bacterium]|nr:geranylgeranyl reductase family protein [Chitinivibrionales bacterium]
MALATRGALRPQYDCVIVGAGPAGLNAGRRLLELAPAATCLIVDKGTPWEHSKPCAEAVGRLGFAEAVPIEQSWVRHRINGATFHAPSGASITYHNPDSGFIISRAAMQRSLAELCVQRGVDCVAEHRVSAVSRLSDSRRSVRLDDGRTVDARVVIDAAGVSSPFGKRESVQWKAYDAEPAYFAIADNVEHAPDLVHLYLGKAVAPGGYAWMFPSAGDSVNIGLLVGTGFRGSVNIRQLLADFFQKYFPDARIRRYWAGTIACGYRRGTIAVPGLVKAGDAANTTNPMSRAGIVEAMKSGLLAAECVAGMLGASTSKEMTRLCTRYERAWYQQLGRRHQRLAETKDSLQRVPDEDFDIAADALGAVPPSKLTMSRIFRTALRRFPRLVWAMRRLM